MHSDPWGITLPEDMARWEAVRAKAQTMTQRCCPGCHKGAEGETPSELESSGDDEEDEEVEEGEMVFPHSPLLENPLAW
jgi:hypothetical protein